jgi:S1-C subfamily serine protease
MQAAEGALALPAMARVETPDPQVGSLALAVARPGDSGLTATLGLISRRFDTETGGTEEYILNTDAVLYPGMSGGALLDTQGQMVGLLNRLYGRGMGVALGVPLVARVTSAVLRHGRVQRGYLGVRTQLVALPEPLRAGLGIAQTRGLLLAGVETGSPADKGGLLLGDTLLKIGGAATEDVADLRRLLRAGEQIPIEILRGGTRTEVTVLVGAEKGS